MEERVSRSIKATIWMLLFPVLAASGPVGWPAAGGAELQAHPDAVKFDLTGDFVKYGVDVMDSTLPFADHITTVHLFVCGEQWRILDDNPVVRVTRNDRPCSVDVVVQVVYPNENRLCSAVVTAAATVVAGDRDVQVPLASNGAMIGCATGKDVEMVDQPTPEMRAGQEPAPGKARTR